MLFKSLAVLAAAAATVSAQAPNHIFFTGPLGEDLTFEAGSTQSFSWLHSCKSGDSTSKNPSKTEVQLVNANNPDAVSFVQALTTFDCTNDVGESKWVVPKALAGDGNKYALRIVLSPNPTYSGDFKIVPSKVPSVNSTSTSSSSTPTSRTTPTSSPTIVLPTTAPPTNSSGTPPAGNNGKSAASSLVPALSGAAALAISAVGAMFL